jgi:hypothetical protein
VLDSERDRIFNDRLAGHKGILFKMVHAYAFEHPDISPEHRVCGPITPLHGVRVFALTWSRNRVRHARAAPRSSPYPAWLRIAANMGSISIADTAQ